MINLEKNKQEKCQPPPPPPFKKTKDPAPFFYPLFLIFQIPPPPHPGQVIKTYSLPFKNGGGLSFQTYSLISVIIIEKAFSVVSSGLELEFYPPLSGSYIYIYIYIYIYYIKLYSLLILFTYYLGQPQCAYMIIKYFL